MKRQPVEIYLIDLFKAVPEDCMYITKEKFANYHHGWKFKPEFKKEYSYDKREAYIGSIQKWEDLHDYYNEEGTETERESGYYLTGNSFAQSMWEAKEFKNKPIEQCIAYRKDYLTN